MRKYLKIYALLLTMIFVISNSISVQAAGSVFYDEDAKEIIFEPGTDESPTNLFENFQNVMPGDVLTDQITIKHNAGGDDNIVVYLRSKGAQEGTEEFLAQLHLTVKQVGKDVLFDAPADETAGLHDWVKLGTVKTGGEVTLELTLEVPITLGDEFQKAVGYIDWEFKVEEIPEEDDDDAPETPQEGTVGAPTADGFPIGLYTGLMMLSGVVLLEMYKRIKE